MSDINQEIAELRAQLAAVIQNTGLDSIGGKLSPFRPRQLHNLNLQPTAKDPRPMFVWSSSDWDQNTPPAPYQEFPKLMWHTDNIKDEITVKSFDDQEAMKAKGYSTDVPQFGPADPLEELQRFIDSLTPEDRAMVVKTQGEMEMATLHEKLSKLSPATRAMLLAQETPDKPKRGRPRKNP